MMGMNVGIVGGGAMGQFLYTQLQQKHLFCLTLYTRTKEQANQVSQQGIYLYNGNQRKHYSAIAKFYRFYIAKNFKIQHLFFYKTGWGI